MHRVIPALSSFSRRLATTITIPPARPSPPLALCLCRASYSSSSSGNNNNSNNDSSSTRPLPPRLLTHSSPLDLMSNLSLADTPSQSATPTSSNPQSTVLDQLGVKLDPTAALSSSARRHDRHASGGKPPKRRSDDGGSAAPFNRTRPPPPRRSGRRDSGNDNSGDSAGFASLASCTGDSANRPRPRPHSPRSNPPPFPSEPRSLDRWDPLKKLPRSTMDRLRFLHTQDPKTFTVSALSTAYGIGYESVKRILRSKFVPEPDRARDMDARRAELKDEWRAKRAREVRDRLARERGEREREREVEVEQAKRKTVQEDERVGEVKKHGGSNKKAVVATAEGKDGGWDWLAVKRAGGGGQGDKKEGGE